MSLKAVHFFFIIASMSLSAFFAVWCLQSYGWEENAVMVSLGLTSLSAFGGLLAYLVWFLKKTKNYSLLAVPLAFLALSYSKASWACAVCFGNASSPLTKAVNEGVWILLYVIGGILVSFASLFIFWLVRAKKLERQSLQTPAL